MEAAKLIVASSCEMDPTARVLFSSGVLEIRPTCLRGLESHSLAPLLAVHAGCNLLGEAKGRRSVTQATIGCLTYFLRKTEGEAFGVCCTTRYALFSL